MEANEQYFHGSVIDPYKLLPTFQSLDETIIRDYSNKSDGALQSSVALYFFFRECQEAILSKFDRSALRHSAEEKEVSIAGN